MLLRSWRAGDEAALAELVPLIYEELRRLASRYMRGERGGHTFRPTDLVAEAYLRLGGVAPTEWSDRLHFFAIAGRTMRQVLVDHARKRDASKRNGGVRPIELDEALVSTDRPEELVALDDALEALAKFDPRKARIVELRYFAGLTQAEIASLLDLHVNTIARDLRIAEAWLHREITDPA
jgi:RNA polymerase sigma factor (TIGR02999 family)